MVTGGVTRHVFESVFAFGQDELHDVGRLTKAEVADRIYGASIGVIGDVLKVERAIGGEMDALWKCRGALPSMNRRLTEVERLEGILRRATCRRSTASCAGGWRRPGSSGRRWTVGSRRSTDGAGTWSGSGTRGRHG